MKRLIRNSLKVKLKVPKYSKIVKIKRTNCLYFEYVRLNVKIRQLVVLYTKTVTLSCTNVK